MLKHLLLTAMTVAFAIGMAYADQSRGKIVIPVTKTSPTSGQQMYAGYCAPCHGVDGKGHGPVASALKNPPTDLTVLKKNNNGRYPDTHIVAVMQFGTDVQAHGSNEMPVWGPILGKMNTTNAQDKQLRISNLSRYIESIQAK
jgi:mono/diheme cytochrome c family protein